MSKKRAIWVEDTNISSCTQCESDFNENLRARNCRKCGQVFCSACTVNKCLVPKDELVSRPLDTHSTTHQNDTFRKPQYVCDECFYILEDLQAELVQDLSRQTESESGQTTSIAVGHHTHERDTAAIGGNVLDNSQILGGSSKSQMSGNSALYAESCATDIGFEASAKSQTITAHTPAVAPHTHVNIPVLSFVDMAMQQASVKIVADRRSRDENVVATSPGGQTQGTTQQILSTPQPAPANPIVNFVNSSVMQAQLSVSTKQNHRELQQHSANPATTAMEASLADSVEINTKDGYSSVDYESDDFEPVGEQSAVLDGLLTSVDEYATDFEVDGDGDDDGLLEPAGVLERDSVVENTTEALNTGGTEVGFAVGAVDADGDRDSPVANSTPPSQFLHRADGTDQFSTYPDSLNSSSVLPIANHPHANNANATALDTELDEYMQPYLASDSQQTEEKNMSIDSLPVYDLPASTKAVQRSVTPPPGAIAFTDSARFSAPSLTCGDSASEKGSQHDARSERAADDTHVQTEAAPIAVSAAPFSAKLISGFINMAVLQVHAKVVDEQWSPVPVPVPVQAAATPAPASLQASPPASPPAVQSPSELREPEQAKETEPAAIVTGVSPTRDSKDFAKAAPETRSAPSSARTEPRESASPTVQEATSAVPAIAPPFNPVLNFVNSAVQQAQATVSAKYTSPARARPEPAETPKVSADADTVKQDTARSDASRTHPSTTEQDITMEAPAETSGEANAAVEPEYESEPPEQEPATKASEGPMVWDEDLDELVPYAQYAAKSSTAADSSKDNNASNSKVSQLRSAVSENRDAAPSKKSKKQLEAEADRTFLASIQYVPPANRTQVVNTNPYGNRPGTATTKPATATITKKDLLRARSAGTNRPTTGAAGARSRSPHRKKSPKRTSSPYKAEPYPVPRPAAEKPAPAVDKRKLFVPPPLLLPSKALPKELADYLFASEQESELKMSLFCQHGRHFASCKADLCIDAHEKYRWLNLIHQKAKLACELVCDADKMWRKKLEDSLVAEVDEKKEALDLELAELNDNLKKRNNAAVRLLKQGVRFYESVQPAMHRGEISPEELHAGTGWTEEHYESFKRRLNQEQERADFRRKKMLDQQAHKNQEVIDNLKNSLSSPMMYLDGMLKSRLEKIHGAVRKIDLCFQYSIKLAVGIGKGKTEEELKAEQRNRSPMKNAVLAERMARNTKHGFDILKASLAIVADVCSDVRHMYRGIRREHTLKQDKKENDAMETRSRSPSQARQSRPKTPQSATRPQSAPPTSASPVRKPKKRAVQSAKGPRDSPERPQTANKRDSRGGRLSAEGSHVSYAEDFEGEGSVEIAEDTFEDEMSGFMHDILDDAGSRRVSSSSVARVGSGSIVEDMLDTVAEHTQRPGTSKNGQGRGKGGNNTRKDKGGVKEFPSLTLSVGSEMEEGSGEVTGTVSEKAKVLAKARALSRSASNNNNSDVEEVPSESEDFPGEANYEVNVGNMYEDDFAENSVLLSKAFGGDKDEGKSSSAKSKEKRKKRSKKVSKLMQADNLLKPLAHMKPTQRNQQSVLHGLLLSNNIPLHYTEEDLPISSSTKQPKIVVTDSFDRPIPIRIVSKTAPLSKSESGPKLPSVSRSGGRSPKRAASNSKLPATAESDVYVAMVRCHQCRRKTAAHSAKHIPVQNAMSDAAVLERAKIHQKATGQYLPSYERVHVVNNTGAQHEWFKQQQDLQQQLLQAQQDGKVPRGSAAMLKYEYPFCSWECVKTYALSTCTLQLKYHTDILVDIAAGYTVHAAAMPVTTNK